MVASRREQLGSLYALEFPDELFEVWEWHQGLDDEDRSTFAARLGLRLCGPFDVLAGKFDGRDLRYPALLHWRYQYDPPELVTVMGGDTDGLHWGYWFDDPGRLPPVVAHFYARDAVELVEDPSLFVAIASHIERTREGALENRMYDEEHAEDYDRDVAAFDRLRERLPQLPPPPQRFPTAETPEGMGIVVAREQLGSWTLPAIVTPQAVLATVESEIAAGRPGTALLVGRSLWDGHHALAFDVLVRAYEALGREPLRLIAEAHRRHPALPSLDVLSYARGDYSQLSEALANPTDVRRLTLRGAGDLSALAQLTELEQLDLPNHGLASLPPALARLPKLASLNLWSNQLTAFSMVLPKLTSVRLGQNALGELGELVHCTELQELDLLSNRIRHLPDSIRGLTKLTQLNLSGNPLEELPEAITELRALKYLALGKCPLRKYPDLSKLTQLVRLYLVGTPVPADEVARLRAALPGAEVLA